MRTRYVHWILALLVLGAFAPRVESSPTNWVYEAETSPRGWAEAAVAVEDPEASGGMARVSYPAVSRRGNVAFAGPMTMEQPPGIYRVLFRLKVKDHKNPEIIAILGVLQEDGNGVSRKVKANEFAASGKYQDFALEFTRAPGGGLVHCDINWQGGFGDTPEPIGTTTWFDKVTFELVRPFRATESAERYPQAWQPKVLDRPAREGPLRVLLVRGPQAPWFRVEEAAALLPAAEIKRSYFDITIPSGIYQITGAFPATREELFQFDVVVLLDVDALALRVHRRQWLADFVRAGGGLLVCGGPYAYGKGRYAGTELEEVLPVQSNGPWDWKSEPARISLVRKHEIAADVPWKPAPFVFWYHTAKVRPDAEVVLEAGKHPLLVTGRVGKGRSAALLATALGKGDSEQTPFWDWPAWPQVMANTLRWLAGRALVRAPPPTSDAAIEKNQQLIVAETTANCISLVDTVPNARNPAASTVGGLENSFQRTGPMQPRDLGLGWPCSLARDAQGRIYIADFAHNRVVRVDDLAGNGLVTFGDFGQDDTEARHFWLPYGLAIDRRGRIYVSEAMNKRIVRFDDMTGVNWVHLGTRHVESAEPNHFVWPLGLALDAQDRLYIADSGNNRIVRLEEMDGKGWTVCDGGAAKQQKFKKPTAVAIGTEGAIYVADYGNNRIVRMNDMSGAGWQAIEGLDQPVSVVLDANGQLYVGLARAPGVYVFRSIRGDGLRVLKTQAGPRGILVPMSGGAMK